MASSRTVGELVDLERYPIDDPDSAGARRIVEAARRELAERGAAELPGFVDAAGVERLVADADALAPRGHRSGGLGTPYLEIPDEHWPADHPRQHLDPYALEAVGYDVIPTSSPLRRLYESDAVMGFVEAILDRGPLYRYADPCGALNLAVMTDGDCLQWHFDQTDFVVSLAVQSAERGGDFDVAPRIRNGDDERYDAVATVLAGDHRPVVTLPMTPGTLLVFEGRHSMHRVSTVRGGRARYVGLLAYDTKPGTQSSELLRLVRYGRSEPFPTPPERWPPS
jgi:hypothetical protein